MSVILQESTHKTRLTRQVLSWLHLQTQSIRYYSLKALLCMRISKSMCRIWPEVLSRCHSDRTFSTSAQISRAFATKVKYQLVLPLGKAH
jgi:hypothetical protein